MPSRPQRSLSCPGRWGCSFDERAAPDSLLVFDGRGLPPDDAIGRYIMRLSMALSDLGLVADQMADGRDLSDRERVHFGRLMMVHMREALLVLEPPPLSKKQRKAGEPPPLTIADAITALGAGDADVRAALERHWADLRTLLKEPLSLRPESSLWDELRRVRNRLIHYGTRAEDDDALTTALRTVADLEGVYQYTDGGPMSADFADLVSINLAFPASETLLALDGEAAAERERAEAIEVLDGIATAFGPFVLLLHQMEALYLHLHKDTIVVLYDDGSTGPFSDAIEPEPGS